MRAMKDSGIEWIGQIPQAWSVGKTIFGLEMPITDGPHETPQLYSEGIPFVSAEAVSTGNGRINFENIRGYISQEYYEECCKKYIPQKEDIYMIKSGATTGRIAIVDTDDVFAIWSPLAVFRCNKDRCISRFLFYTLQSDYYQKQVKSKWSFGTQQNIGMRTLERLLICYPSVPEQERIADYLDAKCAEIDALIAAKEKTNALLKERRQSIIYEAVTKGLNPDAPMKDSGIEWIGEIPEHWCMMRAKFFAEITNGSDPKTEGDIPVYGSGSESFRTCGEFKEGPVVLLGRKGATLHIPHYVEGKYWNVDTAFDVRTNEDICLLKFYYYASICFDYKLYISTTTLPSMTQYNYGNMFIPIPSIAEQAEILQHIENKLNELDQVISATEDNIQKLNEYRQSIIYEAVTGKIEV